MAVGNAYTHTRDTKTWNGHQHSQEGIMLDVIVKRSTWLRGEGNEKSVLLRKADGKMCCLGSVCLTAGLEPALFEEMCAPAAVLNFTRFGAGLSSDCVPRRLPASHPIPDPTFELPASMSGLVRPILSSVTGLPVVNGCLCTSAAAGYLMETNDDPALDEATREARLIDGGKQAGINFTFVD